jgi:uncharacterized protein YegL
MPNPNATEIVVVLDRSGSMASVKSDMEGGFNTFIEAQKKLPGECNVSLFQFDTEHDVVYTGLPLANVPPLVLTPRGGTALYDAVALAVKTTGERFAGMPEISRPGRVIVMVITDGHENASLKHTAQQVSAMVKHQHEKYSWQFAYLGVDENVFAHAQDIGISVAAKYRGTSLGVSNTFAAMSNSTSHYRSASVNARGAVDAELYMAADIPDDKKIEYVIDTVIADPVKISTTSGK